MVRLANEWPRVAIGSSGDYDVAKKSAFLGRMEQVLPLIIGPDGYPIAKLHGLRMLNPAIYSQLPLASADSTNLARNIGIDKAWKGTYQPKSKETRAAILVERIESMNSLGKYDVDRARARDAFAANNEARQRLQAAVRKSLPRRKTK